MGQVFVFVFGAIIGSFLNAVLWRLRTKESFIFGRSYCPHCRHELAAVDLVPIVSYLLLGGKCRYCKKTISPSYLAVELTMGALFLLAALSVLPAGIPVDLSLALPRLLLYWYLIGVFVLVFVFDLRYMMILRSVTLPAAALAALANLALGMNIFALILAAAVGCGFFYLQLVLSKGRWIGGGDVWLGLLMGAALGWPGVLVALFLAYVSGAVFGLALLAMRKKTLQSQLPFGTFLSAAAVLTLLYGERIVAWYLGLVL